MSGRDAAKAPVGQDGPFGAGPWSTDGASEPCAQSAQGRMSGAFLLGYFFLPHSKKK